MTKIPLRNDEGLETPAYLSIENDPTDGPVIEVHDLDESLMFRGRLPMADLQSLARERSDTMTIGSLKIWVDRPNEDEDLLRVSVFDRRPDLEEAFWVAREDLLRAASLNFRIGGG